MKIKNIIISLLLLTVCTSASAKGDVDDIFRQFRNIDNAEYVHIPKLLLKFAQKQDKDDKECSEMLSKISSIKVLSIDKCKGSVRKDMAKRVSDLCNDGYEELIRANDDGDKVLIYTKNEGDMIKELIIFAGDDEDTALVKICGKIKQKDIDKLVDENTK
jgi:hypothetical protein